MKINNKQEFDKQNIFGLGKENTAFAKIFLGNSYLNALTVPEQTAVFLANVTFEPGCRNNWHIHHAKKGWRSNFNLHCWKWLVSRRRKTSNQFRARNGNYNTIRSKTLHGAKADSWFSHIAVEVPGEQTSNEWCEPVDDTTYRKLL